MTARITGPRCARPGCGRPVWDRESGLCSPCWHLARASGADEVVVLDHRSFEFDRALAAWREGRT
jgi:hypothetical protein